MTQALYAHMNNKKIFKKPDPHKKKKREGWELNEKPYLIYLCSPGSKSTNNGLLVFKHVIPIISFNLHKKKKTLGKEFLFPVQR
jgi:hypothetical protein